MAGEGSGSAERTSPDAPPANEGCVAARQARSRRVARFRAEAVAARWRRRGWEVLAESRGPLRTTVIFARPRQPPRPLLGAVLTAAVVVALVLAVLAAYELAPTRVAPVVDRIPGVTLDSDGDGLPDEVEAAGWRTRAGTTFRTDAHDPDSDNDGLSDGEEAGPPRAQGEDAEYAGRSDPTSVDSDADGLPDPVEVGDLGSWVRTVTYAVSDPLDGDTDQDGIGDGDEYLLDMDPSAPDTDGDGLLDLEELDFGSDPTLANADGDSYTDAEESELGSSPLAYDLDGSEKAAAGAAGAKYGDCTTCALGAGLRIEQVESAEYLAGHVASSVLVYGDLRDLALGIWQRKFAAAGLAALGLLPYVGDGTKAVAVLTSFAQRGDRAEQAVRAVTEKLPLSESVKIKILAGLPGRAGRLPLELTGGGATYVVYKGAGYIGITRDFALRKAQHARAGRSFTPQPISGLSELSFGQARSVEEACIAAGGLSATGGLENKIHSINPRHSYYADAVEYGLSLLRDAGATCP